jgi:hypothetical protein
MHLERHQLLGVSLTSMSALALEIVLTRIFSVTMWYHFAFLAISLALMGSATAGVVLYFFPALTRPVRARRWIGVAAVALAILIPITFILYLQIPFQVTLGRRGFPREQVLWLALIYLDLTVPFFLSGLVLSLTLSAWPEQAGSIYWADLTGASVGCLFSILVLNVLGGAGAILAVGALAALAGLVLTWGIGRQQIVAVIAVLALPALVWGNARHGLITITANKAGGEEAPRLYERWNAHSRVTVYDIASYPFFWSVDLDHWNRIIQEGRFLNHALLLIDAGAGTPIQEFRGLLHETEFLRYDLTSFAYHLVEQPRTLVIGPGGGRDVLAALASGAPHVTAVEVNPAVVEAVQGPFADFAGHLYERPDVSIAVDDARGYITRSPESYDIIQASLIDTWAAGGSGAFALSENSLYTVEAFQTYYEHLTDRGILSISRWYLPGHPAETLRLVSTGLEGWARAGVADPGQHVAVVARFNATDESEGMATALFKRTAFTREEIEVAQGRANALGFVVLYAPALPPQDVVGEFIAVENQDAFVDAYPLDISPVTDDRPFFFNLVRFGDFLSPDLYASGVYQTSVEALLILVTVIGMTTVIAILFVLLPLGLGSRRRRLPRPSAGLAAYFGLLGMAFMLVEIPIVQRLTVYLGRPVYSLAVVLFSLLIFSGLGSLRAGRRSNVGLPPRLGRLFPVLAAFVLLHAIGGPRLLDETLRWPLPARIAATVILIAPLGFLMGMPFPTGLRWAGTHHRGVVSWLWGINGVTSVMGSALSVAMAIHVGLRTTLLVATGLYGLAGVLLAREIRTNPSEPFADLPN